jgi:hypothetical protein
MRDPQEVFPVRREDREPCRDFWAMIRWGSVLALAIWLIFSAMGLIVTA